ncbi:MAG: hypothetical protein JWP58_40 [Hymenobacter sp.]|nr:hypothetical protein [Hymenobacter sp.]
MLGRVGACCFKLHIDEPDTVKALYDPHIFTQPGKAAATA